MPLHFFLKKRLHQSFCSIYLGKDAQKYFVFGGYCNEAHGPEGYFLSELVAENNSSLPLAAALPLKSEPFCAGRSRNNAEDHPTRSLPHFQRNYEQQISCRFLFCYSIFFSHLWSFLRFREVGVGKRGKHPSKFPQKEDFRYLNSENFITKWCEFIAVLSNSIWTSTNWWPETPLSKAMLPQGRENPVAPAYPAVVSQQAYWAPTWPGLWGQDRLGLWRAEVGGLCWPGLEELLQHPLFQEARTSLSRCDLRIGSSHPLEAWPLESLHTWIQDTGSNNFLGSESHPQLDQEVRTLDSEGSASNSLY